MSGIYIHIPFCRKACHYCNFHFSTTLAPIKKMVEAIGKEAVLQKEYLQNTVNTIYFGGGTPSLLEKNDIQFILNALHQHFKIHAHSEITLEANPDDITEEALNTWKQIGINRLSIGIQSFQDDDLAWMNRSHNGAIAKKALQTALRFFDNMTIDLIYGSPLLSDADWQQNLETIASLQIPHISCYALTVEPNTALHTMIAQHKKEDIDTEKQSRHFELLCQWAAVKGYEHYEISNFAKPGFRSKHNSGYWKGLPYLGLGPSAHSFNGHSRKWNVSNNALYLKSIEQNTLPCEEEVLTPTQQLNENIMIQLRTMEGIDLLNERWKDVDEAVKLKILHAARKWEKLHRLKIDQNRIYLTQAGKFFADGIAADLFQE